MKPTLFRAVTAVAGVYHVVLALIALLLPAETTVAAFAFALGVEVTVTPELALIAKFIGVYMLAFGGMLLVLASDPRRHRRLAWVALLLFGVRFLNRILYFDLLNATFGMTAARNTIGTALLLFFFVGILWTMPRRSSHDPSHDPAHAAS